MALPAFATSIKAAAIGTTAMKGSATAKAAAATGVLGAIFGSFLMIFGHYAAYRMQLDAARSNRGARVHQTFLRAGCGPAFLGSALHFYW